MAAAVTGDIGRILAFFTLEYSLRTCTINLSRSTSSTVRLSASLGRIGFAKIKVIHFGAKRYQVIHFDRPYYPVILELSSTSDNRGQGDDQSGSISAYQRTVCSERAVATRNCPKTWDFSEYGKEILPGRVSTIREINTATQAFCYDPGSRRVHSTVF